ncbi:MAG: AEC family transporter [Leptothrix sp. (in: b-proteobacteria)]
MLNILAITAPIYLLILLGFVAVRSGIFTRADMKVLGQFVLRFALPALLFKTLSQRSVADILNGRFLLAYAGGSLLVFALGWLWARRRPASYRAFIGMGMSFSNSGFVGAPVLLQWLGPPASVALALAMLVENLIMLPLVLILAERDNSATGQRPALAAAIGQALKPLTRHPLILAIVAGFVCAALGVVLPAPLARAVDLLANASAGVALMVIGGSLVGLQLQGLRGDLAAVAIGKLLLHPLAVGVLVLSLLPDESLLRTAAIGLAAMPMLSIYPVLAQKYRHDGFCAAALLVTTVLSFFTLSGLIWLLSNWGA